MQWLVCFYCCLFNLRYLFETIIAGASMVHPNVPAMLVCPICPHSAGIELTVKIAENSRLNAWLSVDGRNRLELNQEDR